VRPPVGERGAGARDQVLDGARAKDLAPSGEGHHPRRDVPGDAADVVADDWQLYAAEVAAR